MDTLYTIEMGKYYNIVSTDNGIIKTPYLVDIVTREEKEFDDLFYDYLLTSENHPDFIEEKDVEMLKNAGYDLDLDHYVQIKCPYLPFIHFLHLIEHWTI